MRKNSLLVSLILHVMLAVPLVAQVPVPGSAILDAAPRLISVRGGLLFTDHRTVARVDSELLGPGTDVDVERDLGLDGETRDVRVDAALHLGRRHQLQVGYLSLRRQGRTTLSSTIQFGDEVFPVNVEVQSSVELELIPVAYRVALIRSNRLDLGLSAGVFAVTSEASVSAPGADLAESETADFPLPVIGADAVIGLAPGLLATGGAKYFALEVDGIAGSWREARGALEYFPVPNLGLGAGWRFIRMEADGTGGLLRRPEGTLLFLEYEFSGPHIYLTLGL